LVSKSDGVADWQRSLSRLGKPAGIFLDPHQPRNFFALSLLKNGVGFETVAILLGNSVKIAERHYSAFVLARLAALEEAVKRSWLST
jgi:site-specific recombinase XerD